MRKHYVYELYVSNEEEPFYVGKTFHGSYRLSGHISDTRKQSYKVHKIQKAIKLGFSIKEKIVFESYDEEECFKKECELIEHYGRLDIKTGILCNHTKGGEGITGRSSEPKNTSITCFTLEGKRLKEYKSIANAARALNLTQQSISQNCRNVRGPVRSRSTNIYYQFMYGSHSDDIKPGIIKCKNAVIEAVSGDIIKEFKSFKQAAKYFKVSGPTIETRIKLTRKAPFIFDNKEWKFRYKDDIK